MAHNVEHEGMNSEHEDTSRIRNDSTTSTGSTITMTTGVHCCECWTYSDRVNAENQRIRAAVEMMSYSGDAYVRQTDGWKRADEFLVALFEKE